MSRGSTADNGFPCPQCGKRSHVAFSKRNGKGLRRKRKCTSCGATTYTLEQVERAPTRVSTRAMVRLFAKATPARRGLIFRIMESWRQEDASK